jgi:hypothetical protein
LARKGGGGKRTASSRRPFLRAAGEGKEGKPLSVGLLFGQTANDWQLATLAAKRADEYEYPDDKKSEIHQLQDRQCQEGGGGNDILHQTDKNVDHRAGNKEENRLPGMEPDIGATLEGLNDQEDD